MKDALKTSIAADHLTEALSDLSESEKLTLLRRHFKRKLKRGDTLSEESTHLMNQVFQEYAKRTESNNDSYPTGSSTKSISRNLSIGNLTPLHLRILKTLQSSGSLSRSDISIISRLSLQSTCARVNELVALGLIEVVGIKHDYITKRKVELLYLTQDGEGTIQPPEEEAV